MWICNWRQSGFGSFVHRALDLPMCLPARHSMSSPELPSAHCACTDYWLVWLNECTCVYIFYICTVYIYSVYVYIGVYYVYRHVATYPNSPCFKENLWWVSKVNWCGYSKIPQQDGSAKILTLIFLWVCLAEEGHEVKMFTLYQGKFQTERSYVFSRVRQGQGSWKTVGILTSKN